MFRSYLKTLFCSHPPQDPLDFVLGSKCPQRPAGGPFPGICSLCPCQRFLWRTNRNEGGFETGSRIIPIFFLLLSTFSWAKQTRFDMRDAAERNLVVFISDALLERIVGINPAVWGFMELDPGNLSSGIKGEFEVDLRAFETGIVSRNVALREKLLLVRQYPVAKFTLIKLLKAAKSDLVSGKAINVDVEVMINFHKVSRTERATLLLSYLKESDTTRQRLKGNLLKIQFSFSLELSKYQIEIPADWDSRFSQVVQVQLSALGTDQTPASDLLLPDGIKLKEAEPGESPQLE